MLPKRERRGEERGGGEGRGGENTGGETREEKRGMCLIVSEADGQTVRQTHSLT